MEVQGEKNLKLWKALAQPPKSALKQIKGGRLKGMTDVNPQWRIKAITEHFGACGYGWRYEITKLWTEPGSGQQIIAFAQVALYTFDREAGGWSEPIPGIGGSMLLVEEKHGLYTNDEAYKMAVTDALSVALKSLGVAADIYMGLWDGSKYRDPPEQQPAQQKPAPQSNPETRPFGVRVSAAINGFNDPDGFADVLVRLQMARDKDFITNSDWDNLRQQTVDRACLLIAAEKDPDVVQTYGKMVADAHEQKMITKPMADKANTAINIRLKAIEQEAADDATDRY